MTNELLQGIFDEIDEKQKSTRGCKAQLFQVKATLLSHVYLWARSFGKWRTVRSILTMATDFYENFSK